MLARQHHGWRGEPPAMSERTGILEHVVNEANDPEGYVVACLVVRRRIENGLGVDASILLSLAVKGMRLIEANPAYAVQIAHEYAETFCAEPTSRTLEDNA